VFKRIEIITQFSIAVFALAGGTLVPLAAMPGVAAFLGRLLVPVAPGVEAMRDILLGGHSLTGLPSGWGVAWLLAQPVLLVAAGTLAFAKLEALARRRGTLGRY
jgi:ABC-2 type transport system permease protein